MGLSSRHHLLQRLFFTCTPTYASLLALSRKILICFLFFLFFGGGQAFTEIQKKRLLSWKQQVQKLFRSFPRKSLLELSGYRQQRRYASFWGGTDAAAGGPGKSIERETDVSQQGGTDPAGLRAAFWEGGGLEKLWQ